MSAGSCLFSIFWPRNVVKRGICYNNVCPSVRRSRYISRSVKFSCEVRRQPTTTHSVAPQKRIGLYNIVHCMLHKHAISSAIADVARVGSHYAVQGNSKSLILIHSKARKLCDFLLVKILTYILSRTVCHVSRSASDSSSLEFVRYTNFVIIIIIIIIKLSV